MRQDLQVDVRGLLRAAQAGERAILRAAEELLRVGVRAAEASAKGTSRFTDRTGETRGSVRGEVEGHAGFVEAGGAAIFLENGTRPHAIEARGGVLRFEVNGEVVYRPRVMHPGTAPRPFMSDAREAGELAIQEAAGLVQEALR